MKKIYIIESEVNILYGLVAQLSIKGFKVVSDTGITDKESILNKARTSMPDYLILDLALPKIDGIKMLKEIKADHDLKKAVVFVLSEHGDPDARKKAIDSGADHYFPRTATLSHDLVDKIIKIIKNKAKYEEASQKTV